MISGASYEGRDDKNVVFAMANGFRVPNRMVIEESLAEYRLQQSEVGRGKIGPTSGDEIRECKRHFQI